MTIAKLTELKSVLPASSQFHATIAAALELGLEAHASHVLAMVREHSPSESDSQVE